MVASVIHRFYLGNWIMRLVAGCEYPINALTTSCFSQIRYCILAKTSIQFGKNMLIINVILSKFVPFVFLRRFKIIYALSNYAGGFLKFWP